MNRAQANELIEALDNTCSKETKGRLLAIIGHMKQMEDKEIYSVTMAVLGYAFKRNVHVMSNLLLMGHKLIDESYKGDHKLVVERMEQNLSRDMVVGIRCQSRSKARSQKIQPLCMPQMRRTCV